MTDEHGTSTQHLSALASPGELVDWRLALCFETAFSTGILDAVPGTTKEIAEALDLDEAAVADVLGVLAAWSHLSENEGVFAPGPNWSSEADRTALAQHGIWIRRWASGLPRRIRDRRESIPPALDPPKPDPGTGLALLEAATRPFVGPVVDACLVGGPSSTARPLRVLDLGGGHGAYAREFARRGCTTTLQDLPPVIDIVRADGRTTSAGVTLYPGDAFTDLAPGPFDLVLCGTLTNMFARERVRTLFARVAGTLAPGGCLAIATWMRDRGRIGAAFGVQMLVATSDGDAHPSGAYRRLLADCGYHTIELTEVGQPPLSLMTART